MATVYAKAETSIALPNGAIYKIRANEPWDADDAVVKHSPDEFQKETVDVRTEHGWVRRSARGVETATAKPGQKRKR